MRYSTYPSYKPSCIEWLGDVPNHWDLKPLGYVARFRGGATPDKSKPEYWDGDIPWVSPKDMKRPLIEDSEDHVSAEALCNSPLCMIPPDAVLIVVRGMILAHTFPVALTGGPVTINQDMKALVVAQVLQPRFLFWALSGFANALVALADESAHGTRKLETFTLSRFPILLPPSREQEIIVDFLDREAAKLDTLVVKRRALIEKLKEKRSALISCTVTCGLPADAAAKMGLDPHPKLKPSGIDWLGDVPEHWRVTRLKYAAMKVVDCPHETPTYSADGNYLVIRTADLTSGVMDLAAAYGLDEEEFQKRIRREPLLPGDVLYGREGERWGFAALVPASPKMCLGQRMMQFRAAHHFDSRFLMWQLNAGSTYQQGAVDTLGATSPHVNVETIRNYRLSEPPSHEQRAIADYLDRETARIDRMVGKVEEAIERLQEYRAALITAAVTGKIDVRGAVRDREASVAGPDRVRVEA